MKSFITIFIYEICLISNLFSVEKRIFLNASEIDSLVEICFAKLSRDSIEKNIKQLQEFKTRFVLASNKDSVSEWILNKFRNYGFNNTYVDSFRHSAYWNNDTVKTWQKNIIAVLPPLISSKDVFILGAHYDSYSKSYPINYAPGADDNASGVASLLEIARVLKEIKFKLSATVYFIAFAAEEYGKPHGSEIFAHQAFINNLRIKLMINQDMISYSNHPIELSTARVSYFPGFEVYRDIAKDISKKFTEINYKNGFLIEPSDSRAFYNYGFPAIGFNESDDNPYYHDTSDILLKYNIDYCTEISKAVCSTLLWFVLNNEVPLPPYKLSAEPLLNKVKLTWQKNKETDLLGYNIYRYTELNDETIKINDEINLDTCFVDSTAELNAYNFYTVSAIDSSEYESKNNFQVNCRPVTLNKGILLIDETKDGDGSILNPTVDQVNEFYNYVFQDFKFERYDIDNSDEFFDLSLIGQYSTLVWIGDDQSDFSKVFPNREYIRQYLNFGGNFFYSGFYPTKAFDKNNDYPNVFLKGNFLNDVLKITSTDLSVVSRFNSALTYLSGYPNIFIDSTKTKASLNYHLIGIESISSENIANEIYYYNTDYDSLSTQGSMKGLPVAIEYNGDDYKVITLSFPLFYMNREQVKEMIKNVLKNKFDEVTYIDESKRNKEVIKAFKLFQNFPNPFNPITTINYQLPKAAHVKIKIYDTLGKLVKILVDEYKSAGKYSVEFSANSLASGMYFCELHTEEFVSTKKMMLVK